MNDRPLRLAIFGDSHYACVRQAQTQGLVNLEGIDLEYWGHVGRRFNFLELRDGAIFPTDDFTADRFAKFNAKGRRFLPAADFDMILFVGTRVYVTNIFKPLLQASRSGVFITSGLKRRMLEDHFCNQTGYRLARGLAATNTARIVIAPTAFWTLGEPGLDSIVTPEVRAGTAQDRAEIWRLAVLAAEAEGITLIPQPEETVTDGVFSRPEFAIGGYLERGDFEHRNPAYGALILNHALALLRAG